MHANIVANPTQLATLSRVLDQYCRSHHIIDQSERENVGRLVLSLYGDGIRNEADLAARLAQATLAN